MGYQLLYVLVFTLFGVVFVVVAVSFLGRLLRPRAEPPDEPAKGETYECGEPAVGSSWIRFDIRFYTVALVFLVFDVEVTFLYPWALVFKPLREAKVGLFVFAEAALFLLILGVGFVYCWRKGDLDWVKSVGAKREFPPERLPARGPQETPGPEPSAPAPGQESVSQT
jgi:NADH-quinone oxidoreductase subunit A